MLDHDITPRGESPLPRLLTDVKTVGERVEVEWLCETPEVLIGRSPRTVALVRGRYGEVSLRSIRVQYPLNGLPDDFVAWHGLYPSETLTTNRGIIVATLKGQRKATCHCDLPPPIASEFVDPIVVHRFVRTAPNMVPADHWQWLGRVENKWVPVIATPQRGLALVVWSNHPTLCKAYIGGC